MLTGRKPSLTVLEGKRTHRTAKENKIRAASEPKGCDAFFTPPAEISADAKKEWDRIVGLYKQLNSEVLNDLDLSVLAAYCEAVAIYKKAEAEYQKIPIVVKDTGTGKVIENPFLKIMNKQGFYIAKYAEQLCLSPVGRARLGVAKAKAATKPTGIAAFMEKYGAK